MGSYISNALQQVVVRYDYNGMITVTKYLVGPHIF